MLPVPRINGPDGLSHQDDAIMRKRLLAMEEKINREIRVPHTSFRRWN